METNESTNTNAEAQAAGTDILDFDSGAVDRSMPLLPEQLWDMNIKSMEVSTNAKTGKNSLKIVLETTIEARSTQGVVLNPGFPVFHYVGLTPSERYDASAIHRNLVQVLDAIYGKNTNERFLPIDRHVGKVVQVKTQNSQDDASFPMATKVKTWVPAKPAV